MSNKIRGGKRTGAGRPAGKVETYVTSVRIAKPAATTLISKYGSISAALTSLAGTKKKK